MDAINLGGSVIGPRFFHRLKILFLLGVGGLFLLPVAAHASAKIYGAAKCKFGTGNSQVTFGCDGINNASTENATGTIQVRLWALDKPHVSGSVQGKILASYKLDGLDPKAHYSPVSHTAAVTLPSIRKPYYICLTVLEYKSDGYVVTDFRNFEGTTVLGPAKLFTLSSPWSWAVHSEGGTIDINVAKIAHTRTAKTGTLKLAIWATENPYDEDVHNGYELGIVTKQPLDPGMGYSDVKNTAKYKKPPDGNYYVSVLLYEFQDDGYKTVAHLSDAKPTVFK